MSEEKKAKCKICKSEFTPTKKTQVICHKKSCVEKHQSNLKLDRAYQLGFEEGKKVGLLVERPKPETNEELIAQRDSALKEKLETDIENSKLRELLSRSDAERTDLKIQIKMLKGEFPKNDTEIKFVSTTTGKSDNASTGSTGAGREEGKGSKSGSSTISEGSLCPF